MSALPLKSSLRAGQVTLGPSTQPSGAHMRYEVSACFITDFFEGWGRAAKGSLPRCAKRHKLGIQRCKRRASRQIAMLFEPTALFERSLRKAAALERVR